MADTKLVSADDCAALLAFELRNAEFFAAFVPPRPPKMLTSEGMASAIDALVREIDAGEGKYYVAYLEDQIVGRLNISFEGDRAEFGYRVGEEYCGKGFASEFVKFGLMQISSNSLAKVAHAHALSSNPASIHVLQKCGFTQTHIVKDGAKEVGFDGDIVFFERAVD
ncbi:GNAT family N-acetyltransferase [Maritalea sp.]|uniref:GNAT family N-acetyltransferase n=1 Tax=Maritalea sp. TaxID=2003361 RepID=UPI003EF190E0